MKEIFKLTLAIGVCQLAGVLGSIFTIPAIGSWYLGLVKPALSPPNWVFGPVWITLYTLMGISLYLVWRARTVKDSSSAEALSGRQAGSAKAGECNVCEAMSLFLLQLTLNVVWSYLFFGMQNLLFAFIEIIFLLLVVLLVMWRFWNISKWAVYLLIPYVAWLTFAMYLNYSIWQLN